MENNNSQKTILKIITAALAVFFVLLIVALIINVVRLSAVNSRRNALAAQSAELDRVIDENNALIDYCQTPEFIEDYAREYLNMLYLGEIEIDVK